MIEVIFLFVLAFVFLIFAVVSDVRKKEIPNWITYGLIAFSLSFRLFYSLFEAENFNFFIYGLIGFGVFLVLGILFFFSRMFAGFGDVKLMASLGAVLPVFNVLYLNFKFLLIFVLIFLFVSFFYTLFITIFFTF